MSAYIIATVEVTDPAAYATYRDQVGPILASFGGRFLVRGGNPQSLEGDWQPSRVVVLVFHSTDQARAFYDSPAYASARALRQAASRGSLVLVEGA